MNDALSTFDLLTLPADEQAIMRCLVRQPRLGVWEVAETVGESADQTRLALERMVTRHSVVEQLQNGRRLFSPRLQVGQQRVRNMPAAVIELWQPPIDKLLAENRLTATISAETQTHLAKTATAHSMQADEIFAWQGETVRRVGLVRSGLLKRVRLHGSSQTECNGYLRCGDWVGLSEALGEQDFGETLTAATDCQLLTWQMSDLLPIMQRDGTFAAAIGKLFGEQLHHCRRQQGTNKLWVVDGLTWQAGTNRIAAQLATTATTQGERVVLWQVAQSGAERERLGAQNAVRSLHGTTWETAHGFDLFVATPQEEYPPPVYLDLLHTYLRQRYALIICDVGCENVRWTQHLRGQAKTLLTVADRASQHADCDPHWKALQPFTLPKQQRVSILHGDDPHPNFHFHLTDPASYTELYRRLSLDHTIAIFVPSTQAVDQVTDSTAQVQSTLSFLGNVFGGATSSPADGVWNSDEHGLVAELVTVVRTFVSRRALEKHLDEVVQFATQLKLKMQQEAVAIDVDNQLILV